MRYYAMHFNAGNDRNGNPRRFTMLYTPDGAWADAVDEGHRGLWGSLADKGYHNAEVTVLASGVPTTASYRRACLREAPTCRRCGGKGYVPDPHGKGGFVRCACPIGQGTRT